MSNYDCTEDVKRHKDLVKHILDNWRAQLGLRAVDHDLTKLSPVEKDTFDIYTPQLKEYPFDTPEYNEALKGMGKGLTHHYAHNRHHPEHYENGVDGMTLLDVIEMLADWMAAAERNHEPVNIKHCAERFKLSEQLIHILLNTLKEEDYWNKETGMPLGPFCPVEDDNA